MVDLRPNYAILPSDSNLAMHLEKLILPIPFDFPHHLKLPVGIKPRLLQLLPDFLIQRLSVLQIVGLDFDSASVAYSHFPQILLHFKLDKV